MKKIGIIPPHFVYYLENEGIDIVDFKSSDFTSKNSYDRIIVKFPYGNDTLDIQVIFDVVDLSSPPDFIILNECNTFMDYSEIIKNWNFKESKTLYESLYKIKELYSAYQENSLRKIVSDSKRNKEIYDGQEGAFSILEHVEDILNLIQNKVQNYHQLPKSSQYVDVKLIYNNNQKGENKALINIDQNKGDVAQVNITYPLDCLIRSRDIIRAPIVTVSIPINYDMKFWMELSLPHFVAKDNVFYTKEMYNINDYGNSITNAELKIINNFKHMQNREFVITKIIESNIGFPLEIDTLSFLKLSLYCYHSKTIMSSDSSQKQKITNPVVVNYHYLLYFVFSKEDHSKFEFQIVDNDKLKIVSRKKLDYGTSEREINNILHLIVSIISECMSAKKSKST